MLVCKTCAGASVGVSAASCFHPVFCLRDEFGAFVQPECVCETCSCISGVVLLSWCCVRISFIIFTSQEGFCHVSAQLFQYFPTAARSRPVGIWFGCNCCWFSVSDVLLSWTVSFYISYFQVFTVRFSIDQPKIRVLTFAVCLKMIKNANRDIILI